MKMNKIIYILLISLGLCGCSTATISQPLTQEQAYEQVVKENQKLTKTNQKQTKAIKSLSRQRNTLCLIFLLEIVGGTVYLYKKNDKFKVFVTKLFQKGTK